MLDAFSMGKVICFFFSFNHDCYYFQLQKTSFISSFITSQPTFFSPHNYNLIFLLRFQGIKFTLHSTYHSMAIVMFDKSSPLCWCCCFLRWRANLKNASNDSLPFWNQNRQKAKETEK